MKKRNQNDRPSNDKIKELFSRAVEMELDLYETEEKVQTNDIVEVELKEIGGLAERIGLLPPPDQSLLYFHYCFDISDKDAGEILEITRPLAKRIYIENVLSAFLLDTSDSEENHRIGEESMKRACEKALLEYADYNPAEFTGYPVYSKRFRKRLKKIRAAQKTDRVLPLLVKRAAVVLLVISMGFTTVVVADAGFREIVAEWVVEALTEFSRFRIENMLSDSNTELKYKIEYIPDGFELVESIEEEIYSYYRYDNGKDKIVITLAAFPVISSLDTENIKTEQFEFHGNQAYRWKINEVNYMLWRQDELQISILSTLELSEIYNIANGIKSN